MTDTSLITASSAERHPQVRTDLPEGLDDRSLFNPEVAAKLQSLWLDHLRVVEEDRLRAIPGGVQPEATPICPDLEFAPARAASSEHEFREGSAMSKAMAVFSRNLLPFGIVTAIASLPTVLLFNGHEDVVRNAVRLAPSPSPEGSARSAKLSCSTARSSTCAGSR